MNGLFCQRSKSDNLSETCNWKFPWDVPFKTMISYRRQLHWVNVNNLNAWNGGMCVGGDQTCILIQQLCDIEEWLAPGATVGNIVATASEKSFEIKWLLTLPPFPHFAVDTTAFSSRLARPWAISSPSKNHFFASHKIFLNNDQPSSNIISVQLPAWTSFF